MGTWKRLSTEQIRQRVFETLRENIDYRERTVLGVPASHLDDQVFTKDATFLKEAPFLSALVHNPNHIGCHTLGESEVFFSGTQQLEREVIRIVAEDILRGEPDGQDGYVASGGTEANIQAIWIYRNYFLNEKSIPNEKIALVCSTDTHYSACKSANLLNIRMVQVEVDPMTREIKEASLRAAISSLQREGFMGIIVVANMMTTMFGSVDDIGLYDRVLETSSMDYMIHVDGAFGGFVYPFVTDDERYSFKNQSVTSFSIDAHKVLQAPFGTGLFVIRKGWMDKVENRQAEYVNGLDNTLVGSRSGANAVSVWMILQTYGYFGWKEKVQILMQRTTWLCRQLDALNIDYFRAAYSNIVSLNARCIPRAVVDRFGLVPDRHNGNSEWVKIVIMDHVKPDLLHGFVAVLKGELNRT